MKYITDAAKESFVKKNIYSLGTIITLCGAIAALCTFMMKTYIFYKTNAYMDYFGVKQEIIGIEDEYSLFTFSMILIDFVLFIIYFNFLETYIGNVIFSLKYEWRNQNKKSKIRNVTYYIVGLIILGLYGKIIIILFIPLLEIDSNLVGMTNLIGTLCFLCVNLILLGIKLLLKKRASKDYGNENNNESSYVKIFDDFVYYFVVTIIFFLILIGIAPIMGRSLASSKTSFYITEINGGTYAIIYINDDCMLMEKCEITRDKLYLYTNEQLISDKNNHVLVPYKIDSINIV